MDNFQFTKTGEQLGRKNRQRTPSVELWAKRNKELLLVSPRLGTCKLMRLSGRMNGGTDEKVKLVVLHIY